MQKKKKKPFTGLVAFAITICIGATGLAVGLPTVLTPKDGTSAEALAGTTEVARQKPEKSVRSCADKYE